METTPKDFAGIATQQEAVKPKPKPAERRSIPVRNPAFREHEGLRALQRDLNSRPSARKNK